MDISIFQHTAAGGQNTGQAGALGGGSGLFSGLQGGQFWDMIFGNLTLGTADAASLESGLLGGGNLSLAGLDQSATLDGQIALTSPLGLLTATSGASLEEETSSGLTVTSTDSMILKNSIRKKTIMDILQGLLAGLPQNEQPAIDFQTGAIIRQQDKNTNGTDTEVTQGWPGLIATGLDPEKLTALLNEMDQQQATDPDIQALLAMIVKLQMPENAEDAVTDPLLSRFLQLVKQTNDAASGVTNTAPAAGTAAAKADAAPEDGADAFGKALETSEDPVAGGYTKAPELKSGALTGETQMQTAARTPATIAQAVQSHVALAPSISDVGLAADQDSWITELQSRLNQYFSSLGLQGAGAHTNISTQGASAVTAPASTQIIASVISRMAGPGEARTLTVKLDPPELGQVAIRVELAKDKSVKAHIVVEKPETLAMLQRDAHFLERTLASSGIDINGESLSFELAQDGSMFDRNGQGGYAGRNGDGGADGEELIEATMNWSVDPVTGQHHYNLLV